MKLKYQKDYVRTDFDLGHIKSGSHANKESRIFFPRKSKTQNVLTKDTLKKNLNSLPITKKALYQNNLLRTKATIVHVQKILALRTTKWTIVKKCSW